MKNMLIDDGWFRVPAPSNRCLTFDCNACPPLLQHCRRALQIGPKRLWADSYDRKPDHAIGYAQFRSRSHDAVIRVYDESGNMIATHEHEGDFKEW